MAKTEFILQGLTPKSHIDAVKWLFELPDIQRLLLGVAFVSESGVRQIEELLEANAACVTVFTGIRNDTTSYQGLVRLHGVVDKLYTVDTGARAYIFHPKLFLARGKEFARLLVGSANLTLAGLSRNIEAGMLLDVDLTDDDDKALIDGIELQFDAALRDYPDNILRITEIADLDKLLATGRLINENNTPPPDVLDRADETVDDNERGNSGDLAKDGYAVPRMKLKVKPSRGGLLKAPLTSSATNEPIVLEAEAMAATATPPLESDSEAAPESAISFAPNNRVGIRVRAARLRREARARGETTYNTGQPCRYGHYTDRFTCNGKCRECNRQDSEQTNRLGLYR